jgi:hypothetical protein
VCCFAPATLAEMANEAARNVEQHARSAVQNAITAGRALIAAKSQVAHGQWLGWLERNWEFSQPTAHRYMEIANYSHANNLESAASISEALRMISDAKAEKEQPALFEDEPDSRFALIAAKSQVAHG